MTHYRFCFVIILVLLCTVRLLTCTPHCRPATHATRVVWKLMIRLVYFLNECETVSGLCLHSRESQHSFSEWVLVSYRVQYRSAFPGPHDCFQCSDLIYPTSVEKNPNQCETIHFIRNACEPSIEQLNQIEHQNLEFQIFTCNISLKQFKKPPAKKNKFQ